MNTFASGSAQKAQALVLALALPGMLTTWMLNQPDILGQAAADTNPIAAISDIGQPLVDQNLSLDARASFDPNNSGTNLHYAWNFGDGNTASGVTVNHTYALPGTYTLSLTVSSVNGTRHISKAINAVTKATNYDNPYSQYPSNGIPPSNPAVKLPLPDAKQPGQAPATSPSSSWWLFPGIIGGVVIVLIVAIEVSVRRKKRAG